MQQKKIAFVHYPHHVNAARLDTMPFALNTVIYLAKMGWSVDLYLWEEKSDYYNNLLPDRVNIKYLKDSKFSLQSKLNQIRSILLAFQFQYLNRQVYSQNCLDFCQTIVSFDNAWQKFCDQLQYVNIKL